LAIVPTWWVMINELPTRGVGRYLQGRSASRFETYAPSTSRRAS
jgi:hypothetical protein